jgi:cytoplasmic FMR1 interacting protein
MKESKARGAIDGSDDLKAHNSRYVAPGASQLHVLRSMVRSFNDGTGRGHFVSDTKDKDTFKALDTFYADTLFFPYMGSYANTVQAVNHLGDLWYRELYIEITKQTQFPIEMSLPFILTEHVVHNINSSAPLLENVCYVLDVYNDAAFWALQTLQAQHLYDELEAEVNLVFDQAVFLMGDEVYSHFKNASSSEMLDRNYKEAIEAGKGYKQLSVDFKAYSNMTNQHHILLLGRSIDLNYLISTHLNHKLSKDVEVVIKRFEGCDLANILEIELMLEVVKLTHKKLSALGLSLDSFEDIFKNANHDVNAVNVCGKIIAHIKTTVLEDVVVNYALNVHTQRFKRSPIMFKQTGREGRPKLMSGTSGFGTQCGKAWDYYCNLSRGFVGRPHIEAMVRMVGEPGINFIMAFFMEHIEERIKNSKTVLGSLSDGLPPIKLPKVVFGTAGCFGMFEARLKQYFQYMDFLDESYQVFREIGNVIALVGMLESSLSLKQTSDYINAAAFLGTKCNVKSEFGVPKDKVDHAVPGRRGGRLQRSQSSVGEDRRTHIAPEKPVDHSVFELGEVHATALSRLSQNFVEISHTHMSRIRAPKVIDDYVGMTERAHDAYDTVTSTPNLKIGKDLVDSISACMKRVGFADSLGHDGGPESIMSSERTDEFHRVYSVLNFLICMEHKPRGEEESTNTAGEDWAAPTTDGAVFGHGFGVAGVMFLHILGQSEKFKLLDLSSHVLKVHEQQEDMKWRTEEGGGKAQTDELTVASEKFVAEARSQKDLHDHIFGLIEVGCENEEDKAWKKKQHAKYCFSPPEDDRDMKSMGENEHIMLHKYESSGSTIA